jgi:hypothetical protein
MSAYYTIVQCVPDPVIDERINIGVIVFGDGTIRSRFIREWRRVQCIGVKDVQFLRDFAERVENASLPVRTIPGVPSVQRFDEELLRRAIGDWSNSIQFTEPKGSLREPERVLEDVAARFLRELGHEKRVTRTRSAAAKIARESVKRLFQDRFDPLTLSHYVKTNPSVPGKVDMQHRIDVGVANGVWRFGAYGLSFELVDADQLENDYTKAAFVVSDIRAKQTDFPIGVVMLPPTSDSSAKVRDLYRRAQDSLPRAGADLLQESDFDQWVDERLRDLEQHIPH